MGKTIALYDSSNTAQYRLDVSKQAAGIYYAPIITGGKMEMLKFVKE